MNHKDFKAQMLRDPEVREAYQALGPEYDIINELLKARRELNMTQKELAAKSGIPQAKISRLETGNANPNLSTLKCLAEAVGKTLQIALK